MRIIVINCHKEYQYNHYVRIHTSIYGIRIGHVLHTEQFLQSLWSIKASKSTFLMALLSVTGGDAFLTLDNSSDHVTAIIIDCIEYRTFEFFDS